MKNKLNFIKKVLFGKNKGESRQILGPTNLLAVFQEKKPFFLDVGARGGIQQKWIPYYESGSLNFGLVEVDEKEINLLKEKYGNKITVIPFALGDENVQRDFFLTEYPGCSSVLEPNFKVLEGYPVQKWFKIKNVFKIDVFRFDFLKRKYNYPSPDILKIDVQGFEYNVLEGFGEILNQVSCIELEAQFIPIYKGQKILMDIHALLKKKGFVLRKIEPQGPFEGEVVEVNMFFSKKVWCTNFEKNIISLFEKVNKIPPPVEFSVLNKLVEVDE